MITHQFSNLIIHSKDFSEFGIAPKKVKAKDEFFSTTDSFAGFRENLSKVSTIDDVLKDVITLKSVSIGIKILKRMKKNAAQKLSKHNYINDDRIFPLEFDENELKSYFLNPKKNLNGLGYKGLKSNLNFNTDCRFESDQNPELSTVMKDGKKLKITGEAFGYGALDEDDGYEAEVYSFDDLSKYDYTLGKCGNRQQNQTTGRLYNSILSDTNLMDDFHKSDEHFLDFKLQDDKKKIIVPSYWKPKPPIRTKKVQKSRWDNQADIKDTSKEDNSNSRFKKSLNAIQRADLLGESTDSLEREEIESKLNKIKEEQIKSIEEQVIFKEERLKRPLSGFFAHKFVQSEVNQIDALKPGLTKVENLPQTIKQDVKINVESKSFVGKSDREIFQWHPHKLICKRFNVPHPYPQFPDVVGILVMNKLKQNTDSFLSSSVKPASSKSQSVPIKQEIISEVIEEFKKPDMNLFKAVFDLSDDDDDDDGELSDIEEIVEEIKEEEKNSKSIKELPINNLNDSKNDLTDNSKDLSDRPRIVFNKSFVKKSDTSKLDLKEESTKLKSSTKTTFDLFEDEIELNDEEGINLLNLKMKKSSNDKIEHCSIKSETDQEKSKEQFKEIIKDDKIKHTDEIVKDKVEFKTKDNNLIKQDKIKKEVNIPIISDSDSSNNDLDDMVNEIVKSSSHKKKRKKHKEHKKHKRKKHKKSNKHSD